MLFWRALWKQGNGSLGTRSSWKTKELLEQKGWEELIVIKKYLKDSQDFEKNLKNIIYYFKFCLHNIVQLKNDALQLQLALYNYIFCLIIVD